VIDCIHALKSQLVLKNAKTRRRRKKSKDEISCAVFALRRSSRRRRAITACQATEYENRQRNEISREVITATKHVRPVCSSVRSAEQRRRLHGAASDAVQEPRLVVVVVYYLYVSAVDACGALTNAYSSNERRRNKREKKQQHFVHNRSREFRGDAVKVNQDGHCLLANKCSVFVTHLACRTTCNITQLF